MLGFTRNAVWSTVWTYEYRDENLGAPIFSHTSLKYPSLLPGSPEEPGKRRGGDGHPAGLPPAAAAAGRLTPATAYS